MGRAVGQESTNNIAAKIDQQIQKRWSELSVQPAAICSDEVFVRRVHIDLVGRIPTIQEAKTFLNDQRADKRAHLVDTLLASEDYVQNLADIFDTLLMGRGDDGAYGERSKHGWRAYLEDVFRSDRCWNNVVAEFLLARPDPKKRGAVWFLYERKNEYQKIAEAIGPAVFGVRIECAQCHDHMMADEIKQEHYWGLVAFFNRGKNANSKQGPAVAESAIGGFSDFANLEGDSSPNRLTFLNAKEVHEQRPQKDVKQEDKDELYEPATDGQPRVPKFSRRAEFVKQVVAEHPLIGRAFVNRVWAILMGRGIVHPFDEMDSVHDPSHPELLNWLAEDFVHHEYRIKRLIRGIALSRAYQLDSLQPKGADDPATFAWYLERPLTAEQLARSTQLALRGKFDNGDSLTRLLRRQFAEVLPDENLVTISDALFLTNNQALNDFVRSSNAQDHLFTKLISVASPKDQVNLLYQTFFGRGPSDEERNRVAEYIRRRDDTSHAVLSDVMWAMFTSAEFRFNH